MRIVLVFLSVLLFLLAACQAANVDCSTVDEEIALLEQEKAENDRRIATGVDEVIPPAHFLELTGTDFEENTKFSTATWAQYLDQNIKELKDVRAICRLRPHFLF